jgi:hypothetical protein
LGRLGGGDDSGWVVRFVDGRRRGAVGGAKEALKKLKGMHDHVDGSTAAHYDMRNDSLARQRSRHVWIGSQHTTKPERRRTTGKCVLPLPSPPDRLSLYREIYPTRSYTTITASFSFSLLSLRFLITEGW